MWIALLMFLFVVLVFIAIMFSKSDSPSPASVPPYVNVNNDNAEQFMSPVTGKKKNLKSVTFADTVTERVFNKAGIAASDHIIPING